jgi:hypothetical protein
MGDKFWMNALGWVDTVYVELDCTLECRRKYAKMQSTRNQKCIQILLKKK